MKNLEKNECLFFTGIKHSGKTTFAKFVAKSFEWNFFDSDDQILKELNGITVREFYKKYGEASFRKYEFNCTKKIIDTEINPVVMSLGGGVSDNPELMEYMKNKGSIIYLRRKEEDMLPVILKHGVPAFLDPENLSSSFHDIYVRRDKIYSEYASLIVDLGTYRDKTETGKYLVNILKENGYGL